MTDNNDKPMYGVWLAGKGWLKGSDVFADYNLDKAKQVARLVNGSVRFVDKAIIDLETLYLQQESRTLWNKLMNILNRLLPSSNSGKKIHN